MAGPVGASASCSTSCPRCRIRSRRTSLAARRLCSADRGAADSSTGRRRGPTSQRATSRLRFEEAFVLQAVLAQRRAEVMALPATRRVPAQSPLLDAFDARLPFELTSGQVGWPTPSMPISPRPIPMHRLLQGDVGSGKTVVALRAMLRVVDAGGQAALLAPTEVLAAQHYRSITELLGPLARAGQLGGAADGTRVALLTGSQRTGQRRRELARHRLRRRRHRHRHPCPDPGARRLPRPRPVVVDEQHRFGVEQRAALSAKSRDGSRPHVLVMTATPIPAHGGDDRVRRCRRVDAGRAAGRVGLAITTHVVVRHEHPAHVARVWQRVREEVDAGPPRLRRVPAYRRRRRRARGHR